MAAGRGDNIHFTFISNVPESISVKIVDIKKSEYLYLCHVTSDKTTEYPNRIHVLQDLHHVILFTNFSLFVNFNSENVQNMFDVKKEDKNRGIQIYIFTIRIYLSNKTSVF